MMLGFAAAKRVVELGRSAFFPEQEPNLPNRRSTLLRGDDMASQFGHGGAQFPSTRMLLTGLHPGNGGNNDSRIPADRRMMPSVLSFAQSTTEDHSSPRHEPARARLGGGVSGM